MGGYNAAGWLLDRHVEDGRGDRVAIRCGGDSMTYAELQADTFRAQQALAALGVEQGDRVVLVVNDEPAFPAWFLGALRAGVVPVPISTMLTAAELAAHRRRRRGPGRRRVGRARAAPPADRRRRADRRTRRRHRRRATTSPSPCTGGPSSTTRRSAPGGADDRRLAGVLAVQLRARPALPKGVMHRHGSLQATADTYAARVLGVDARRPLPVRRQAVLRLRPRQQPDVPARRRGDGDPRAAPADAAGHRRARRRRAADAVLRQPRLRRRPARHRRPGDGLRQRAGDRDGRRVAARRPAATLQRALRASRARRHRLDRGAAHLPVQHASTTSARARAADRSRATRPGCSTTAAPRSTRPDTPGLPPRARTVRRPPATGSGPTPPPRRSSPTAGCARATSTPARPTTPGRSSGATTT